MENIATEGFRTLAAQGTGWLLFCIAVAGGIWLFKSLLQAKSDLLTTQQAAQAATEIIWRERLVEKEAALTLIHAGTLTNQKLAENLEAAREANEALATLVQQIDRDMKVNDTHWKAWAASTDKCFLEIMRLLNERSRG
jgi:PleD family two-component response regulator